MRRLQIPYLRPGDEDGDFVQSPQDHLRAGGGGEAAVVAVVLTHVVLRQEAHQRERLDFGRLAFRGRTRSSDEWKCDAQPEQVCVCLCVFSPL